MPLNRRPPTGVPADRPGAGGRRRGVHRGDLHPARGARAADDGQQHPSQPPVTAEATVAECLGCFQKDTHCTPMHGVQQQFTSQLIMHSFKTQAQETMFFPFGGGTQKCISKCHSNQPGLSLLWAFNAGWHPTNLQQKIMFRLSACYGTFFHWRLVLNVDLLGPLNAILQQDHALLCHSALRK